VNTGEQSESKGSTLGLLVTAKLEVLASLQCYLHLVLAHSTLHPQNNLLRCLGFLVEDRFSLPTITRLLSVVSSFPLCEQRRLAGLVLGDLMWGVFSAVLALAKGAAGLGDIDHFDGGGMKARLPVVRTGETTIRPKAVWLWWAD